MLSLSRLALEDHPLVHKWIAPCGMQLWHAFKVHAVNTREKCERDENRGHDVEYLHHLILSIADTRQIDIHQAAHQLSVSFSAVDQLHTVVVGVAKMNAHRFAQELGIAADQRVDRLSLRPDRAAQCQQFPPYSRHG